MARHVPIPRKQRTRQHVIADQSVNHVERIIIDAGHTAQRLASDYGYDVSMVTFDEQGYVEPGSLWLQVKATETLNLSGTNYVFDMDLRDFNLWTLEAMPVILILFEASRRKAYWLHVQNYFQDDPSRKPRRGSKTIRVRVPSRQAMNLRAIAKMREAKQKALDKMGVPYHV